MFGENTVYFTETFAVTVVAFAISVSSLQLYLCFAKRFRDLKSLYQVPVVFAGYIIFVGLAVGLPMAVIDFALRAFRCPHTCVVISLVIWAPANLFYIVVKLYSPRRT